LFSLDKVLTIVEVLTFILFILLVVGNLR